MNECHARLRIVQEQHETVAYCDECLFFMLLGSSVDDIIAAQAVHDQRDGQH
jgi:hypothetical protein